MEGSILVAECSESMEGSSLAAECSESEAQPCLKTTMNVQHQIGALDCGLFALAFATSLCLAIDPTSVVYNQSHMRNHLIKSSLEKGQLL